MSRAREIRVGLVYIPVDSVQNLNIIVGTRSDWIKSTNLTDDKFFSVIGCRLNGDNDYFLDGVAATDIPENILRVIKYFPKEMLNEKLTLQLEQCTGEKLTYDQKDLIYKMINSETRRISFR
jgi:hypothetical protein